MQVRDLIKTLSDMPEDAWVFCVWDGAARTSIEHVWVTRGGMVAMSDYEEYVWNEQDRPVDAPTAQECRHWTTPAEETQE